MNTGRIEITPELLLEWLQLRKGGKVKGISLNGRGLVEVSIEHPEIPKGNPLMEVSFTKYTDNVGRWVALRNPLTKRDG